MKAEELSFENALNQLEELVDSLENGETPLAELVAKYEQGSKLLKNCEKKLSEAKLKIEQLDTDSKSGETTSLTQES